MQKAFHPITGKPISVIQAMNGRGGLAKHEHMRTEEMAGVVERCISYGLSPDETAKVVGISTNMLRKCYLDIIETAKLRKNINVAEKLYSVATNPEHKAFATSAIFWLKTQGGPAWRDQTQRVELTGPDGSPLQVDHKTRTVDAGMLSADQRDSLREIMLAAMKLATPAEGSEGALIEGSYEELDDEADVL